MDRRKFIGGSALSLGGLGLSPLLAQQTRAQNDLVGLAIGNDAYANLRELKTAAADATAIGEKLASPEFGYAMDVQTDVGMDGLFDAYASFIGSIGPNTSAFLFLAGHGVQLGGRNYFLPVDVPRLTGMNDLATAVPIDNLLDLLAAANPAQTIVVLDACRNAELGSLLPGHSSGLASTNAPGGCFVAYSAGAGEYALDRLGDDDPVPNGLFTRHFLESLRPERTIYEVVCETRSHVVPEARAVGHSQVPAIYDQASRQYRIDGRRPDSSPPDLALLGSLEGTGVVLAASQAYACVGLPLITPIADAWRIQQVLTQLGAEVHLVLDPDYPWQILDACSDMAGRGFNHLAFIWSGMGGMIDYQATALLDLPDCPGSAMAQPFATLTHSQLIRAFRPAGMPAPYVPLTLLFDACLTEMDGLTEDANPDDVPLHDLADSFLIEERYRDVAVLAASSYFETALDVAPGQDSSPFTIALLNALAAPDMQLREVADRINREVATLTNGIQSPMLFASRRAEERSLVRTGGWSRTVAQDADAYPGPDSGQDQDGYR